MWAIWWVYLQFSATNFRLQGNVTAGGDGVAHIDITDKQITLIGVNTVVGRSMVVHEKRDDLGACIMSLYYFLSPFNSTCS